MIPKPESALIIAGHGSTVNPDSAEPTHTHADAIRARGIFREVVCAFWKEEPGFQDIWRMIESPEVYVVPNFISAGYFTRKVLPRELGLDGPVTRRDGRVVKYCEPVGSHPRMTELILHRAAEVAPKVPPESATLLVIGHGTSLNENSGAAVKEQVRRINALGRYAEVFGVFMEEEPFVMDWRKIASRAAVVAVPFFVSDGLHSFQDIPVLLGMENKPSAAASRTDVFRRNPHLIDGRELYYAGAIGTEPLFADLILEQVEAFDREIPNWQ
jgi:sirohydrochlorin cobaltochelatase